MICCGLRVCLNLGWSHFQLYHLNRGTVAYSLSAHNSVDWLITDGADSWRRVPDGHRWAEHPCGRRGPAEAGPCGLLLYGCSWSHEPTVPDVCQWYRIHYGGILNSSTVFDFKVLNDFVVLKVINPHLIIISYRQKNSATHLSLREFWVTVWKTKLLRQ